MNKKHIGIAFFISLLFVPSAFGLKRFTQNYTSKASQYIQLTPEEIVQKNKKKTTVVARKKKNSDEAFQRFVYSQKNPKKRVPSGKITQ